MNNLSLILYSLFGVKVGTENLDMFMIDGEFSFFIAAIFGCVMYCALSLFDYGLKLLDLACIWLKAKWLLRNTEKNKNSQN